MNTVGTYVSPLIMFPLKSMTDHVMNGTLHGPVIHLDSNYNGGLHKLFGTGGVILMGVILMEWEVLA